MTTFRDGVPIGAAAAITTKKVYQTTFTIDATNWPGDNTICSTAIPDPAGQTHTLVQTAITVSSAVTGAGGAITGDQSVVYMAANVPANLPPVGYNTIPVIFSAYDGSGTQPFITVAGPQIGLHGLGVAAGYMDIPQGGAVLFLKTETLGDTPTSGIVTLTAVVEVPVVR